MNIFFDVRWQVEVDDVFDVRDVKTTSSDCCCHQNWDFTRTEEFESILTLVLGAIAMDTTNRISVLAEEMLERISASFRFDEYER